MGQAPYPWRRLAGAPPYPDDMQDFLAASIVKSPYPTRRSARFRPRQRLRKCERTPPFLYGNRLPEVLERAAAESSMRRR